MNIVLDACSIINLVNGNCIDKVLQLDYAFYIGDMLLEQEILSVEQKIILEMLIQNRHLQILSSNVSISNFIEFTKKHDLGLGESECLLLCKNLGYTICTDDKKARICSGNELGKEKVVGSLYLLKASVKATLINCGDAIDYYKLMRFKGGFLPKNLDQNYFCKD